MAKKIEAAAETLTENVQETGLLTFSFGKKKSDSKILNVPYTKVHVQKDDDFSNPRKKLGDLEVLKTLIKTQGILNPPVVRKSKTQEGHYTIVAGERRFRAMGELKYEQIPVNYRPDLDTDDLAAFAVAVAENSSDARYELSPLDRGESYARLETKGWTIKQIAKECGAHDRDVRRCLDLIEASERVKKSLENGKLSFIAALEVARQPEDCQKAIFDKYKDVTSPDEDGPTALEVKRFSKAFAKGNTDGDDGSEVSENGDGEGSGKKKGRKGKKKVATAGGIVWKSKKHVSAQIDEIAFLYLNGVEEGKGDSAGVRELRGALGVLLWQTSDLESPYLPDTDVSKEEDPEGARKQLKYIDKLIKTFAAKYVPPEEETSEEGEPVDENADTAAV